MQFWKGTAETTEPADLEARNLERLRAHMDRIQAHSGFYRQRWQQANVDPAAITSLQALRSVPTVSKQDLIEDQHQNPPFGDLIAADPEDLVRLYVSPGPQATYFTRADLDVTASNAAWVFWCNGFRPADVVDVTINYHWVIAGTIMDDGFRTIGCTTIPGGLGKAQMHLENLRWSKATGLFAFPTFLEELAKTAEELGMNPATELSLRRCTIAGEMHSAGHRAKMEEFWGGMTVREMYGGAEVPFSAAECEMGNGMHLNPDFLIELLHPETREPVDVGEPGVVVVSETERQAYPMVRYWTGDLSEGLNTDPCDCGRTTPRLGRIMGRVGDIPRVKGLFVVPKEVAGALADFDGLGDFQLVIDRPGTRDELTVRIEHDGPADHRADLEPRVVSALKAAIQLTAEVRFEDPGTLEGEATVVDNRDL